MNSIKPDLQILPGSAPGKIRIVGSKAEADIWIPQILADRQKIKSMVKDGDQLVELILLAATFYGCPSRGSLTDVELGRP